MPALLDRDIISTAVMQKTDLSVGWEPIFEYEGETLAEMPHEKKVGHTAGLRGLVAQILTPPRTSFHIDIRPWSNFRRGYYMLRIVKDESDHFEIDNRSKMGMDEK